MYIFTRFKSIVSHCTQWGRHELITNSLRWNCYSMNHVTSMEFRKFRQQPFSEDLNYMYFLLSLWTHRNDKFADVLLFPSQMDGGYGIPAHKIILSSCSHVCIEVPDVPDTSNFYVEYDFFLLVSVLCTSLWFESIAAQFIGVYCVTCRNQPKIDTNSDSIYVQRWSDCIEWYLVSNNYRANQ